MVTTTFVAEESIYHKLNRDYIEKELKDAVPANENIALVFVCVGNDWRKNDTWKHKGKQFHQIILPYEKVAKMSAEEVRQLMLQMAEERLGLVKQS